MQEQSPSPINGAILRHPHKKAEYWAEYRDITDNGPDRFPCSYAIQNLDTSDFRVGGFDQRPEKDVKEALSMFQKLEASGILEKDWAYQIEFGLNPLLFFQARPFKKLQLAQDFKIPYPDDLSIHASPVFGITPEEGIEVNFLVCEEQDLRVPYKVRNINQIRSELSGRAGLLQVQKFMHGYSSQINLKLGELTCFRSPCEGFDFLFHDNYRFMKKADISFVGAYTNLEYPACQHYDFRDFKRARVISNGESGAIIPIK